GQACDVPIVLPVAGDIAAGDQRELTVPPGHAYRIMTGAPLPARADVIVPVELTDGGSERVQIRATDGLGRHIRRAGEDVETGDIVLRAGTRLGPRQLALVAAVGHGEVSVHPRPRVVCLSTGDELVAPGTVPGFGEVVDSNSLMLVAALREAGCEAHLVSGVRDTEEAVMVAMTEQLDHADALVTTGGVSMGVYDAVKAALSQLGTVQFDQVAMQPGKPQGFGTLGERRVPVFTLPGNPVSALVSFEVFVAPALRLMAGRPVAAGGALWARVLDGWPSPTGKVQFVRGVVEFGKPEGPGRTGPGRTDSPDATATVRSAGGQGSHVLHALSAANALVLVPADVEEVVAGDVLECRPLGAGWERS
ncbi:MAG: molybdopterin molybdotransferase MoeA, partial [Micrococcales bacterium]|nr:molybdopterin molybdotransferase MoeA [Micrococcales bacterium]